MSMTSGAPMVNGDISRGPGLAADPAPMPRPRTVQAPSVQAPSGTLEEALLQMNILIQENRDLKEALRQTNLLMKERFEGLSAWREKQKEEREFLEGRLQEAQGRMETLTAHNQELGKKVEELEGAGGSRGPRSTELDALRAQVARLQAEKNDLVAMNSELQLKMGQGSLEDSFVEIITITDRDVEGLRDTCGAAEKCGRLDVSMTASRQESEEVTVSQLLQSLRRETEKVERLETELQASKARISELEEEESRADTSTQTSLRPEATPTAAMETEQKTTPTAAMETERNTQQGDSGKEEAVSEVEKQKSQMRTLFNEMQQAQSKLGEAEGMKKNLQDRCRQVEKDVVTMQAQLLDRQAVQTENDRLKLQLDSMQAQSQLEQRKTVEERNNLLQLKDAYTKLFEDYNELKEGRKKRETELVPKEVVDDLQARMAAAEQALATKQGHIDAMKQEMFLKEEKELETIAVFQAQAEVYSSDFYAERAAREKIHEEKERLAAQLEFVKKQNNQLQDEMDSLGRQSLNEMQRRHVPRGGNPHGGAGAHGGRGDGSWQQHVNIPEHACPKCNEILPDLDSLQIHIMDCII